MADRISYAEACRDCADVCEVIMPPESFGSIDALRELAALVERAEKLDNAVATVAGFVDILSSEERPTFEEWDAIVRTLAAGFDPQRAGAREGR